MQSLTHLERFFLEGATMKEYQKITSDIYDWGETAVSDLDDYNAWNDPDILQDLFGDRLFDEANRLEGGYKVHMVPLCEAMKEVNKYHIALAEAMDAIIDRHSK